MKVRVNILLEKEIAEKAHELGINISKVSENALKQYIQALGNVRFMKQDDFLSPGSSAEESGVVGSSRFTHSFKLLNQSFHEEI